MDTRFILWALIFDPVDDSKKLKKKKNSLHAV